VKISTSADQELAMMMGFRCP